MSPTGVAEATSKTAALTEEVPTSSARIRMVYPLGAVVSSLAQRNQRTCSILHQPPEQQRRADGHDGVRTPDGEGGVDLARAREVAGAQKDGIVDQHDWQETGDEGAEVIAAAKPDADGAADKHETEAAERQGRSHVEFRQGRGQ